MDLTVAAKYLGYLATLRDRIASAEPISGATTRPSVQGREILCRHNDTFPPHLLSAAVRLAEADH
jgi:hypothetical protein